MNWGRGLFRCWLLVAMIWIGMVGFFYYLEPAPVFHFSNADITKVPSSELLAAHHSIRMGQLTYVGVGLGVPFALLLLGAATLWAVRGFQHTKSN